MNKIVGICAYNQVLRADSDDDLQITIDKINVAHKYNVEISYRRNIQKAVILLGNKVLEQVSEFKHLGHFISDHRSDMVIKLHLTTK
jgi:hypothetical protein